MNHDPRDVPTVAVRGQHTAPSGGGRAGLRVTPALFGGVLAAVVLMLLTVVFLLTAEPATAPAAAVPTSGRDGQPERAADVPGGTATAEPTTDATPSPDPEPTGEPRFGAEVDPCGLVGRDLQKKLVLYPKQSQIYKEECEWTTLPSQVSLPGNMSFRLKIYVKVFPEGLAKANEQYLARRADAARLPGRWDPVTPPIGEASYSTVWTLPGGTNEGPTTATVGVRVSNAVIEVEYNRRVPEDGGGRLAKGAVEVARVAAEALAKTG